MKNKADIEEKALDAEGQILDAVGNVNKLHGYPSKIDNIRNILYLACSELNSLRLSHRIAQHKIKSK